MKLRLLVKSLFSEDLHPRAEAGDTEHHGGQFIRRVALDAIDANPHQPRKDFPESTLRELAASIKENGLLQPPVVREHPTEPGRYQIIGGERRTRAMRLLGHTHADVSIKNVSDREMATLAMLENISREDMNPIDEASGYAGLIKINGWDIDQLAEATGKAVSTLKNKLLLNDLIPEASQLIAKKQMPEGYGVAMAILSESNQRYMLGQMTKKQIKISDFKAECQVLAAQETAVSLFADDFMQTQRDEDVKKHGRLIRAVYDKYRAAMDAGVRVWKTMLDDQTYKMLPAALEGNLGSERRKVQGMIETLQAIDKQMAHAQAYQKTHGSLAGYIDSQSILKVKEGDKKRAATARVQLRDTKATAKKLSGALARMERKVKPTKADKARIAATRTALNGALRKQARLTREVSPSGAETTLKPKSLRLALCFFKSQVKGHSRTLKSGKVVQVRAHSDKRVAEPHIVTHAEAMAYNPAAREPINLPLVAPSGLPVIEPPEGWTPAPPVISTRDGGQLSLNHTAGRGFLRDGKYYKPETVYGAPVSSAGMNTDRHRAGQSREYEALTLLQHLPCMPKDFRRVSVGGEPYIEMPEYRPLDLKDPYDADSLFGDEPPRQKRREDLVDTLLELDKVGFDYGDVLHLAVDPKDHSLRIIDFSNCGWSDPRFAGGSGNYSAWNSIMRKHDPEYGETKDEARNASMKKYSLGGWKKYIYGSFNRPQWIGIHRTFAEHGVPDGSFEIEDTDGRTKTRPHSYIYSDGPLPDKLIDNLELELLNFPPAHTKEFQGRRKAT